MWRNDDVWRTGYGFLTESFCSGAQGVAGRVRTFKRGASYTEKGVAERVSYLRKGCCAT